MTRQFFSPGSLLLTGMLALAAIPGSAAAQPAAAPSHVPIPRGADLDLIKEFENESLSLASALKAQELTRKFLESPESYGLKREDLEALRQKFQGSDGRLNLDMRDPKWQELMGKALAERQRQSFDQLSKTDLDEMQKWLTNLAQKQQPAESVDRVSNIGTSATSLPVTEQPPQTPPAARSEAAMLPIDPSPRPTQHPALTRNVIDFAERLQDRFPEFRNSETMKRAMQQTVRVMADVNHRANGFKSDWRERLPQWLRDVRWDRLRTNLENSRLADVSLPHWRSSQPTRLASRQFAMDAYVTAAAAPASNVNAWSVFLWAGTVLAGGLVVWKLLKERGSQRGAAKVRWRLGPWPVPPHAVRTRDELVRAFEHLALLCLGPAARHWHHREIAGRLSARSRDSRAVAQVASNLAQRYERARYAPMDEPLSDVEIALARRELCLLAGVSAV